MQLHYHTSWVRDNSTKCRQSHEVERIHASTLEGRCNSRWRANAHACSLSQVDTHTLPYVNARWQRYIHNATQMQPIGRQREQTWFLSIHGSACHPTALGLEQAAVHYNSLNFQKWGWGISRFPGLYDFILFWHMLVKAAINEKKGVCVMFAWSGKRPVQRSPCSTWNGFYMPQASAALFWKATTMQLPTTATLY